jgi:hypothetical protein
VRVPIDDGVPDIVEFTCPRCGHATAARFYGPCRDCVALLRAQQGTEHGTGHGPSATVAAYEPKMNVTPNFIATKD